MKQKQIKISLLTSMLLCSISSIEAKSTFEGLGYLEGDIHSQAWAVSGDGKVVVGTSSQKPFDYDEYNEYDAYENKRKAFRWTKESGMISLGKLPSGYYTSEALAVNSDGTVIVGSIDTLDTMSEQAFRWTKETGVVGLGFLPNGGDKSYARGVSTDGSVVVGYGLYNNFNKERFIGAEAFRWTQETGMIGLGDLEGGENASWARKVSGDGKVVVGSSISANGHEAFRWTQETGMLGLGDFEGGEFDSIAWAVNADGSVIVGYGTSEKGQEAFRWTQETGMLGLGDFEGGRFHSSATAINAKGDVIVGYSSTEKGEEAFRWTQETGMQSLSQWLGINIVGWEETAATGVSDDANTIVGTGKSGNSYEAFIAKAGQGMIGITDFTTSLESINSISTQTISNVSTLLNGAHGHPGNRRAIDDKRVMWLAGDISSDNRHNSKDDGYIGEFGLSFKHNEQITYSLALGKMLGDRKLDYKGSVDNNGAYIIADTDIRFFKDLPLYSTSTLAYGKNSIEIKRAYNNAGALTLSKGNTDESFLAFKQKFQYQFDTFFPYLQYNYIRVKRDAYSESGGGFSAMYNKVKESVSDFRIGLDANFNLNESNTLITTLEGVHRVQDRGHGVSGQIVGLNSFDIQGREYDQNWVRATIGLEHTFENNSRFTITLNRTSEGEDPTFWTGFNYSISF